MRELLKRSQVEETSRSGQLKLLVEPMTVVFRQLHSINGRNKARIGTWAYDQMYSFSLRVQTLPAHLLSNSELSSHEVSVTLSSDYQGMLTDMLAVIQRSQIEGLQAELQTENGQSTLTVSLSTTREPARASQPEK